MLGDEIRRIRKEKMKTQVQLAKEAEMDKTMLCKVESNRANPSINTLEKIAKALGTTASKLMEKVSLDENSTKK